MRIFRFYILSFILYTLVSLAAAPVYAQQYVLRGRVIDSTTKKNVGFAVVVIKEAGIVINAAGGIYYAELPAAGTYTVKIQSDGLRPLTDTVTVDGNVTRDFMLSPFTSKGNGVVIKGERVIQKLSRRTMKVDEIKEVPASFGDSVNALTSLPGVIRSSPGGFFGPLVIRGADTLFNRYYIDGMPIDNPLHFGGIHSVIANDLMSSIDLYSSSFPSEFGGPLAAVISINTLDEVKEFGGWADVGLISACALIKKPVTRTVIDEKGEQKEENKGYIIASGRVGYLSLFIPLFYKLFTGESLTMLPEYWDYQFKAKYYFDSRNSITLLCLGSMDYWDYADDREVDTESGGDPLLSDIEMNYNQQFHNQGVYYTYDNMKVRNTVMVYSAWSKFHMFFNSDSLPADHWLRDITIDCMPYIAGLKDSFRWEWMDDIAVLRGGVEFTYYHFNAEGDSFRPKSAYITDLSDPDSVDVIPFSENFSNTVIGGYLEQRFTPGGAVIMPSFRSEYMAGSHFYTLDPRLMMSYRFTTDTTVSAAGGHYSSFFQTNPYVFQGDPTYAAQGDSLEPEMAWHSAAGIEQVLGLFTISSEFFFNYYYNLVETYPHDEDGKNVPGINSGKRRAGGIELMAKLDSSGGDGFFGWGSYTYTKSQHKSGLPLGYDPNGDEWIASGVEQNHSLKIVAGYRKGEHSVSCKFQLYSSFPYTPITGSTESPAGSGRFAPEYDLAHPNSRHLPVDHQLDIRYTHRTNYEWGYLSWYIELINVYGMYHNSKEYRWRYDQPYSDDNPRIVETDNGLSLVPNFGVEVKF